MAKRRKRHCKFGVNKKTKACLKTKRPRKSRGLMGHRRRRRR